MSNQILPDVKIKCMLPDAIMERAVRGLTYIAHPLRLRILEYLDVYGASSVSAIARAVGAEQMIVSQSLRKMRDADLVQTGYLYTMKYAANIRPVYLYACANCLVT